MSNREAGKGSAPRKAQDQKSYSENHSKIFGPSKLEQRLQKERSEKMLQEMVDQSQALKLYD